MTIYEIKRRVEDKHPHYFNRQTLKFFGQTLAMFKVYKQQDGRYHLSAPIKGCNHNSEMYFNPVTNGLERK